MKRYVYCLWDKIAQEAGLLFEAQSDTHAQRMLESCEQWPQGTTKDDFEILKLGEFFHGDDSNAPRLEAYDGTRTIAL